MHSQCPCAYCCCSMRVCNWMGRRPVLVVVAAAAAVCVRCFGPIETYVHSNPVSLYRWLSRSFSVSARMLYARPCVCVILFLSVCLCMNTRSLILSLRYSLHMLTHVVIVPYFSFTRLILSITTYFSSLSLRAHSHTLSFRSLPLLLLLLLIIIVITIIQTNRWKSACTIYISHSSALSKIQLITACWSEHKHYCWLVCLFVWLVDFLGATEERFSSLNLYSTQIYFLAAALLHAVHRFYDNWKKQNVQKIVRFEFFGFLKK